jgi:hypothetical protein
MPGIGGVRFSQVFSRMLSNCGRAARPLMSAMEDVDEISLHRASRLHDLFDLEGDIAALDHDFPRFVISSGRRNAPMSDHSASVM